MGTTTDFRGKFIIDRPVDDKTYKLLVGLNMTRRMKRADLPEEYGIDGEFYFEESDFKHYGCSETPKLGRIVEYNEPPSTQPGLWCHWQIQEDKQTILWDGGVKFYFYVEWIKYLVNRILKPRGYIVSGKVDWVGEDAFNDRGTINISDNVVTVFQML